MNVDSLTKYSIIWNVAKMSDLHYVIIACYPDKGMKSCGSKGLIHFQNQKLLDHQISWISKHTKNPILVIANFDYPKILKSINRPNIKIIDNLGENPVVKACQILENKKLCFIDYGCIFDNKIFKDIELSVSSTVFCIKNSTNNNLDVGCIIQNDYIEHMFFDLPKNKFCNIFTISKHDCDKIISNESFNNKNLLYFEIFNLLINQNSKIKPIFIKENFIYFNNMRQKNAVNKFIKKYTS